MLEDLLARKLVEVAPAALVVATAGGEIVSLNPFVEALFGVPRAEALGGALERIDDGVRRVLVLTSKGAEPPVAPAGAHVERLCAESLPPPRETHAQPLERRYLWARRRDGVERAVELQSGTLELEGAGFVFIALRDATEERQAIEALARSEERLQRAQRVAKLGSWEWNLRDQTVVRSAQTYAMYGIEPDMDTDRPLAFLSRVPAEERERVSRLLSDAVASGHAYTFEHRMVRPDGEVRVFLQQGVPERENGTVVRFVGTALDITDLRTAERERESALAELRAVLDQCPVGITIAHGPDAARVESNRAARALLGGPIDEGAGVGQFAGRLFAADGTPVAPEHLPARRVLRGERIEREELLLRRADGSLIPLELDAAPVRGGVTETWLLLGGWLSAPVVCRAESTSGGSAARAKEIRFGALVALAWRAQ